ncbi:MAG TPA: response regulator transcription factor [Chitinophagaceae bacterium]|nr:response regulator transcription factor [Chitinophagaceae bacterium]
MSDAIKVVLVDDHALLRHGLANTLTELGHKVLYECKNGKDLTEQIRKSEIPAIVLMDINMPEMDGFDATLWLKNNYPLVKVIALSMFDDEDRIIRMLKNGARGYVLKDISPEELNNAIQSVIKKGFYYSDLVSGSLIHSINADEDESNNDRAQLLNLKPKDIEFLKLICTEMTYKEIAEKMYLSPRTIDGYRDDLFQRLGAKSRVGLVLYAIKKGVVHF